MAFNSLHEVHYYKVVRNAIRALKYIVQMYFTYVKTQLYISPLQITGEFFAKMQLINFASSFNHFYCHQKTLLINIVFTH